MNTSEWITDRLPNKEDGIHGYCVVYNALGHLVYIGEIKQGEAWKPLMECEPYVKPKRWSVHYCYHELKWCLQDVQAKHKTYFPTMTTNDADSLAKMKRLANAYQEVLP
ncbi:hypothetical protein UFOVP418_50 [uncultured Caudovirales phage]|uniref:Uncharacterized protein n=1 Tax=uncultured Caudovirales phage TaxID=2100421 RepID=A0A6J5M8K7_9CAUD|nr:hypothetical protein UFOVP418_50 [uncultured Caudovirales phage]